MNTELEEGGHPDPDELNLDTFHTAILYRDGTTGTAKIHRFDPRQIDDDDIQNFFKYYKCYDLIHTNTKLVLLDTRMTLVKALHAMMEQGVRACPLWCSTQGRFVGMMTITDFIRILRKNYQGPDIPMEAFQTETLGDWKDITHFNNEFLHLTMDAGLIDACRMLIENNIHRLPIIDPVSGDIFSILNQKPLLKFLFNIPKVRTLSHLNSTIEEAGVGSFDNIAVAHKETKVIEALNRLLDEKVAALPIVDEEGKLVNIFSKFDVFNLESFADLEITLDEATKLRMFFDGVYSCKGSDSVLECLEKLVRADVNRLVVVDGEDKVEGIVTVSDMIAFLVLRHNDDSKENSPTRRNTRANLGTSQDSEGDPNKVTFYNRLSPECGQAGDSENVTVIAVTPRKLSAGRKFAKEDTIVVEEDGVKAVDSVDSAGHSAHTSLSDSPSDCSPPRWFRADEAEVL